jgi:hypothetical protein
MAYPPRNSLSMPVNKHDPDPNDINDLHRDAENIIPTPKLYAGACSVTEKNGLMKLPRQYPMSKNAFVVIFLVWPEVFAVATAIDNVQVAVYENDIQRHAIRP